MFSSFPNTHLTVFSIVTLAWIIFLIIDLLFLHFDHSHRLLDDGLFFFDERIVDKVLILYTFYIYFLFNNHRVILNNVVVEVVGRALAKLQLSRRFSGETLISHYAFMLWNRTHLFVSVQKSIYILHFSNSIKREAKIASYQNWVKRFCFHT